MITLPHLAFRGLPYTINDDFHQNLLYSGCFTEGKAINESLFQHHIFIKILVFFNNQVSSNVNWYYYVHYLLIWLPISLYFIKFLPNSINVKHWGVELFLILFLGIWITREFTFTWISCINGIIAWVWFWKPNKKIFFDWFSISLLLIINFLVRPPSFIFITIVALIVKASDYFFSLENNKYTINKLLKEIKFPLILLLLCSLFLGLEKTNGVNKDKFPFAWVTEEDFLAKTILVLNKSNYDDIDLNVSKVFYFDDRFEGSSNPIDANIVVQNTMGYLYFKQMLYKFGWSLYRIFFQLSYGSLEFFLLIILLPLHSKSHFKRKSIFLSAVLSFLLLLFLYIGFNMPLLKPRVILPPLVFILFYFTANSKNFDIKQTKNVKYGFITVISIYLIFYSNKSLKNAAFSKQIMAESKLNRSVADEYLYMDQTSSTFKDLTQVSRWSINKIELQIMPFGWMMLSNTFHNCLKIKGFNNLDEAFSSGRLVFLNKENDLPSIWDSYFRKYYDDYSIEIKPLRVMGKEVFSFRLIK